MTTKPEIISKTALEDGDYTVFKGIAVPRGKRKTFGTWAGKIAFWLFCTYLVLATANCAVQEAVKIHTAVVTVAK